MKLPTTLFYLLTVARFLSTHGLRTIKLSEQEHIREQISNRIEVRKCGPIFLRLAWHDAGTYDKSDGSGGPRAAMRWDDSGEALHGANAGLKKARDLIAPIVNQWRSVVSEADVWAFGGAVAIEALGGPRIDFRWGRQDAQSPNEGVPDGRLPDGAKGMTHLKSVFGRMGFDIRGLTALSGAHSLGACHKDRSGFEGQWTKKPTVFDNKYFVDLKRKKWTETVAPNGNTQYKAADGTIMLPTDMALLEDEEAALIVDEYADNEEKFFDDFAVYFKKLVELGYTDGQLYYAIDDTVKEEV